MVSRQLVYVTGMLEVILAPSDPSGRLRPPAKFSWYLAILAGVPDAPSEASGRLRPPAKFSWYPAILAGVPDAFPTPRKPSNNLFGPFRALGNLQRRVFELSDASETFSGVFLSFPRPRKRSAARFDTFRGVGRRSNEWRKSASTCAPLPPLRICPIFTPT